MKASSNKSGGMSLLKRGQKGLIRFLFSRMSIIIVLLLLQLGLLFSIFVWFRNMSLQYFGGTMLFSACMVLYLINTRMDPTAKITWLIIIMLLPVFGALLLWFTQSELGHRALRKRVEQLISQTDKMLPQKEDVAAKLYEKSKGAESLSSYINRNGCQGVHENTSVKYYPLGDIMWQDMLDEISQAKDFIFMEYFIVDEGKMWGMILEALVKKASEGVDVRFMYDGMCEFTTLSHDYPQRLEKLGIKCRMFAPIIPMLSTHYNYRDHRKIMVIDGQTAFTGGVNLADEYINNIEKHGHWKDAGVMLKGEAVDNFTLMFLQLWNITEKEPEFDRYVGISKPVDSVGFVQPFGDCPLDNDKVSERVYMDILNRATDYVSIMTPYLIMDSEMETALKFTAERGVLVRLILPGITDNPAAYALAKTHYATLIDSGVEIYEYSPGFVHSKVVLCDDIEAVVGTINIDYRSFYHHYECAVWMYDTDCIKSIEDDFTETLTKCRRVTEDTIWQGCKLLRPIGFVLKAVAPLM